MTEDIPFGIVPMSYLGHMVGVPTPIMNSFIELASIINERDYWKEGWTFEKMGIAGMTIEKSKEYLQNG